MLPHVSHDYGHSFPDLKPVSCCLMPGMTKDALSLTSSLHDYGHSFPDPKPVSCCLMSGMTMDTLSLTPSLSDAASCQP
eukprot:1161466-Pelagomonas_calceolata.AAC.6